MYGVHIQYKNTDKISNDGNKNFINYIIFLTYQLDITLYIKRMGNSSSKLNFRKAVIQLTAKNQVNSKPRIKALIS